MSSSLESKLVSIQAEIEAQNRLISRAQVKKGLLLEEKQRLLDESHFMAQNSKYVVI
jgi:peptidoglycan hydrolase CwlO-like protein